MRRFRCAETSTLTASSTIRPSGFLEPLARCLIIWEHIEQFHEANSLSFLPTCHNGFQTPFILSLCSNHTGIGAACQPFLIISKPKISSTAEQARQSTHARTSASPRAQSSICRSSYKCSRATASSHTRHIGEAMPAREMKLSRPLSQMA